MKWIITKRSAVVVRRLVTIIIATILITGSCRHSNRKHNNDFESFFPDSTLYSEFETLKAEMESLADSINGLDSPGSKVIEYYFSGWKKLQSLNKTILDKKFSVDSTGRGRMISYFNFLDYAVSTGHAGLEFKEEKYGYNWEEIVEYYRPKVLAANTDDEFIRLCDEMTSVLDDAHTYIGYKHNELLKSLMADVRPQNGKWRLTGFHKDLPSRQAKPGDELLLIDGHSPQELWNELIPLTVFGQFGNMDELFERRFLRTYYYNKVYPSGKDSSILLLRKSNADTYRVKLKWHPVRKVRNMYGVRIHNHPKTGIEGKILQGSGYGYIKIDKWNPDYIATFDSLFDALYACPGLILDIRNNFGGDYTNFGQRVLASFHSEDKITLYKKFRNSPLYHIYGFNGLHYADSTSVQENYYNPVPVKCEASSGPTYNKPVVLLVNGKHFSSNDLFLIAWHEWNTGPVVGRMNDFQLSGQPVRISTPWNGWSLGLSVMLPLSGNKVLYEDQRIPMDVFVPLCRDEIMMNTDPVLDSGIVYLNRHIGKASRSL